MYEVSAVDSFVKDGKLYVNIEAIDVLNSIIAQSVQATQHMLSDEQTRTILKLLQYYGEFADSVRYKHIAEL